MPDADVTAVLVGFDTELTYQKVENACRLLARERISWPPIPTGPAPRSLDSSRTVEPSVNSSPGARDGGLNLLESPTPP